MADYCYNLAPRQIREVPGLGRVGRIDFGVRFPAAAVLVGFRCIVPGVRRFGIRSPPEFHRLAAGALLHLAMGETK